jgi:hypothetical protein
MPSVDLGASETTHVRSDGTKPHGSKKWQLVALADGQFGPAMEKDDQGAGGKIKSGKRTTFSCPHLIDTNRP